MATKHRRNPSGTYEARYRLHDGTVVSATGLRRMFNGKIPGPKHRKLLGIERVVKGEDYRYTKYNEPDRLYTKYNEPDRRKNPGKRRTIAGLVRAGDDGVIGLINHALATSGSLDEAADEIHEHMSGYTKAEIKAYLVRTGGRVYRRNPSAPKRRAKAKKRVARKHLANYARAERVARKKGLTGVPVVGKGWTAAMDAFHETLPAYRKLHPMRFRAAARSRSEKAKKFRSLKNLRRMKRK